MAIDNQFPELLFPKTSQHSTWNYLHRRKKCRILRVSHPHQIKSKKNSAIQHRRLRFQFYPVGFIFSHFYRVFVC